VPLALADRIQLQRAYKFRIYPTAVQEAELSEWMRQLRFLWNLAHEQRLAALARPQGERPGQRKRFLLERAGDWAATWFRHLRQQQWAEARLALHQTQVLASQARADVRVDYFTQSPEMTELLSADPQLARVVCSARQQVLRDLETAWRRYWKRLGGQPEFKPKTKWPRIYLSTNKAWGVTGNTLMLSGIASTVGPLRIHRETKSLYGLEPRTPRPQHAALPWPGDMAHNWGSCSIKRDGAKWYAVFRLEHEREFEPAKGGMIGINRGAIHAIADSNGRVVDSPSYYGKALERIRKRSAEAWRKGRNAPAAKPRYRMFHKDPGALDRLAADLGTSLGNVIYQVRKRGGIGGAVAHIKAHAKKGARAELLRPPPPFLGRNKYKALQRLARAHQIVRQQRASWLNEQSSYYASRYRTIAIEDLGIKKIVERPKRDALYNWSKACRKHECGKLVHKQRLCKEHYEEQKFIPKSAVRRSILDVGWYEFGRQLEYKAQARGGQVIKVNPGPMPATQLAATEPQTDAGISRQCASCGATLKKSASGNAVAYCDACLNTELGDTNAARNVLLRAMLHEPAETKTPKASLKIKGRASRSKTTAQSAVEASGGDPLVEGPVEGGMPSGDG
jgi:transposase